MARAQRLDNVPLSSLAPDLAFRLGVEWCWFTQAIYATTQAFTFVCHTSNAKRLVDLCRVRNRPCNCCWIHEDKPDFRLLEVGPSG